jgi:hypothetical protein
MTTRILSLATIGAAALFLVLPSSYALSVMDIHPEDLVRQASDVRKTLNLNPNQQLLWQQVESKIRMILQVRQLRRERLQADLQSRLDDSRTELRDLAGRLDAEDAFSSQEDKQLRDLWLTVNDALDDNQRQIILAFLADQLQRSVDQKAESKSNRQKSDTRVRGMGRQGAGNMSGGMP